MIVGCFLLLCIPVVLVALWATGRWVLGPFTEAVRVLHAPTRFFLSDFFWLLVLLQASFAIARLVLDQRGSFLVILIFLIVASTATWAGAVSVLSRAAVHQTLRRGIFTLVLLPAVLLLMGAVAMGLFGLIAVPVHLVASWPPEDEFAAGPWFVTLLVGIPAIIAAGWALRRLTCWIVAGIPPADFANENQKEKAKP
ncbi:MAG: hypothetical protein H8E44_35665 [Planctomycetes bacterium]|nr:hypothetical protein [Planctomycetota bacterium]MBL7044780.1 hypothetical protein [Pirellulaceae bacterium]